VTERLNEQGHHLITFGGGGGGGVSPCVVMGRTWQSLAIPQFNSLFNP